MICEAAAESKVESIQDMKWRPAIQRAGERVKQIKTRKVKQEDASKNGEQGIGDECGKVLVLVWRGKKFVNGEIWLRVGGKENVGDVMQGHEFHNKKE